VTTTSTSAPAIDWRAIMRALPQIIEDVRDNEAPPPPVASLGLADTLEHVSAVLPSIILTLRSHQGVVTGAADLLSAMADAGVPHAAAIRDAVLATPGALDAAEAWLPRVMWAASTFAPAATGIPGAWAGARGHI
jgi:hypothetical protein